MEPIIEKAAQNLRDTVYGAIQIQPTENVVVIYDTEAPLTRIILEGYKQAIPEAEFIDFTSCTVENVREKINALNRGDLVVLLQSTNFRLNEFRFRIELFERGLKTIEHIHLARIDEDQFQTYVNALFYDANFYRPLGHELKKRLDVCEHVVVTCAGTTLTYPVGMESTKLNIGDYTGMKNVGGTFPIGEVFTESKDLTKVNGAVKIFAYAGMDHKMRIVPSFTAHITDGVLTAPEAPQEFQEILKMIAEDEEVLVREFGLGLNRELGKEMVVNDITAFERQLGLHLSLGAKHAIYPKPGLNRKTGRYHVDVFVDIETITIDNEVIYQNGAFTVV